MADFDFKVNDRAFHRLDRYPVIDENLYGDLIDTYAPGSPYREIALTPSAYWPERSLSERLGDLRYGASPSPFASYSGNRLSIPAHPDASRTNKVLLHEAGHDIDNSNPDMKESSEVMHRHLKGVVALAGTGVVLGLAKGDKRQAAKNLSPILLAPVIYAFSPHEISARDFAADKDIQAKYGKIFTYKDL